MGCTLQSITHRPQAVGPFGVNPMGPELWVPNHKWAHLAPFWSIIPKGPKVAMASCRHQRPSVTFRRVSPQDNRNPSAEMGHIWYYIPLCTICPQKFNGDTLRTPVHNLMSSGQFIFPFQRKTPFTQHYNPWWYPEDHSSSQIFWPFSC
ncbi:hypothetical protein O181_037071 [Austropuccinia psidii MF-1]|uniref:Uncharacterized protein n=1 Tax=Austropuccinia psidii MF-1 TaxID=1389203 RepID=A0A9Q3D5I7_9BASI|nr:hypothetical protein [Austropuccinia psidii MF-1]